MYINCFFLFLVSASRHSHWGHHYSPIGISADRIAPREESEGKSRYNVMARQKRQRAEEDCGKEAGGGAPSRWRLWGAGCVVGCRGDGPHYGVSRCQDLSEISRTEVNVSASSARVLALGTSYVALGTAWWAPDAERPTGSIGWAPSTEYVPCVPAPPGVNFTGTDFDFTKSSRRSLANQPICSAS